MSSPNTSGQVIERIVERKGNVRSAAPERTTVERCFGAVADRLSRRNIAAARCELCNEALHVLVDLCFERNERSELVNIDSVSGQILVPMPCGWRRYKEYGLRRTEADVLRFCLLYWQQSERFPLFEYIRWTTRWCVNIEHYTTAAAARGWLEQHPVTPRLWAAATDKGAK